jgi:hypothetical protein
MRSGSIDIERKNQWLRLFFNCISNKTNPMVFSTPTHYSLWFLNLDELSS